MFPIDRHPPNGVLMWTTGALVAAALLRSRAALALTFFGATIWSLMEVVTYDAHIHWPFLLVWGAAFALTLWMRWSFAHHLAFASLLIWTIVTLVNAATDGHWSPHGTLFAFIMMFTLMLAIAFVWQLKSAQTQIGRAHV